MMFLSITKTKMKNMEMINKAAKDHLATLKKMELPKMPKFSLPKLSLPKVTRKQAMVAGAVAGATLLCTIAGYSIYVIKKNQNKLDFSKMKVRVMDSVNSAKEKLAPMAAKASDYAMAAARKAHASIKARLS